MRAEFRLIRAQRTNQTAHWTCGAGFIPADADGRHTALGAYADGGKAGISLGLPTRTSSPAPLLLPVVNERRTYHSSRVAC
jgi:hypothetical protein